MSLFAPAVRRPAGNADARIRALQADLCEARAQGVQLAARLRAETNRADRAAESLDAFRVNIRTGHQRLLGVLRRLRRENELLRLDRENALREIDRLTRLDAKTLATVNGGKA